jgi:hypothetical protein
MKKTSVIVLTFSPAELGGFNRPPFAVHVVLSVHQPNVCDHAQGRKIKFARYRFIRRAVGQAILIADEDVAEGVSKIL